MQGQGESEGGIWYQALAFPTEWRIIWALWWNTPSASSPQHTILRNTSKTTELSSCTVTAKRNMWLAGLLGIMTWHDVSPYTYFPDSWTLSSAAWKRKTLHSIFTLGHSLLHTRTSVTRLHSFKVTSCSTYPLHLNHQVTIHGRGSTRALTGQQAYGGRELPSDTGSVSRLESSGSGLLHGGLQRWSAVQSDNLSWGSDSPQ